MKKQLMFFLFLFYALQTYAQPSLWTLEAEDSGARVTWDGNTADIVSPRGTTLWFNQKMEGNVTIEYEAKVVVDDSQTEWNRLSDLNCFWMASEPTASSVFKNLKKRGGTFLNSYQLQLYYMGFGGNHNTTTRFRRYNGDKRGVTDETFRPDIINEYTDPDHLLKPNHWYDIRLEAIDGRVRYFIDGELLVDWLDPQPLTSGWFGFRTTLSHTQLRNFKYTQTNPSPETIQLNWIGGDSLVGEPTPVAFGIPFRQGEVAAGQAFSLADQKGNTIAADAWNLAFWPDGSVKWKGFATVAPPTSIFVSKSTEKGMKKTGEDCLLLEKSSRGIRVDAGVYTLFLSGQTDAVVDSILVRGRKVSGEGRLVCSYDVSSDTEGEKITRRIKAVGHIDSVVVERSGTVSCVLKVCGTHLTGQEEMLPFVVRLYIYYNAPDIKMVHSFVVDSLSAVRRISSLGISFDVPMREQLYDRHIRLDRWTEPVQPLSARRMLFVDREPAERVQNELRRVGEKERLDNFAQQFVDKMAAWGKFRLSQLAPGAFSIRKATTTTSPWIGTIEGTRANGTMFVGDVSGGMVFAMRDFWQSFPSSLEVSDAREQIAKATLWLWSPEAEPMNLAHYDTIPHTLEAAYEDVQPGLSTPYGIARTSVLFLRPVDCVPSDSIFNSLATGFQAPRQMVCTPQYLHSRKAFGIWSLPDYSSTTTRSVEERLSFIMDFYKKEIDRQGWYGFWNYGDVMHQFDRFRNRWMYDVGGYAWDNTELASNMMFWYNFLRSGDADVWRMAEAMSRHTPEVDVYHIGPNGMLGSRHNVSHWGCGAKEARISQAAWNRFYYYLTTDERTGDLMTEVKDADQMLCHLDPMRLAQPRGLYPCTAPARLRIGPDWLAYAANWMTEWERTGNTYYRDKIIAGMKSISEFQHGIFSGPLALGYYPDTGVITNEADPAVQHTNHLLPIMGGFEVMNEMIPMVNFPQWNKTWLDYCRDYKQKALELSNNHFRIPRLQAYAGWLLNDTRLKQAAWRDILRFKTPSDPVTATNDAATWTLDAIFILEVAK